MQITSVKHLSHGSEHSVHYLGPSPIINHPSTHVKQSVSNVVVHDKQGAVQKSHISLPIGVY